MCVLNAFGARTKVSVDITTFQEGREGGREIYNRFL